MDTIINRTHRDSSLAPGPKGHWLLGSLSERQKDPLKLFLEGALNFGDVVRFRFFSRIVHLVTKPEYIKHILQDNHKAYIKGFGYDKLEPVLGKGLLTSEGAHWHRQRKLAQPAFHRQRLIEFSETMVQSTSRMLDRWDGRSDSFALIDVSAEMMRLTMEIVGLTLLSTNVADHTTEVGSAISLLIEEANRRITSIFRLSEHFPTPENKRFERARTILDELIYSIIKDRRRLLLNNPDKVVFNDLLSMLMAARDDETGEQMSDEHLRDEIMTIFLAGHETTANALSWTWYLLSKHPHCLRKVQSEVDRVLRDGTQNPRLPRFEDLTQMPYTLRVLEESMRLYPPAWLVSREALTHDQIGDFTIHPGELVILSPYVSHRLPQFWENPEGFDPDRFLPEAVAQRPKYVYFPFSGGPRQCIGNGFALMEAHLILTAIASRYQIELPPGADVSPEPLVTLRPRGGLKMYARRRASN